MFQHIILQIKKKLPELYRFLELANTCIRSSNPKLFLADLRVACVYIEKLLPTRLLVVESIYNVIVYINKQDDTLWSDQLLQHILIK